MPKITLDLTEEQVKQITSQAIDSSTGLLTSEDKSILHKGIKEHDCIFKDDFKFADRVNDVSVENQSKADTKFWALYRIKKYIHDNDLEFKPDWQNLNQGKYDIYYDFELKNYYIGVRYKYYTLGQSIFFRTILDTQQVISNCRADLDILRS